MDLVSEIKILLLLLLLTSGITVRYPDVTISMTSGRSSTSMVMSIMAWRDWMILLEGINTIYFNLNMTAYNLRVKKTRLL